MSIEDEDGDLVKTPSIQEEVSESLTELKNFEADTPEALLKEDEINKVATCRNTPTICVIGKTGVGKSTLCNAILLGPDFAEVKMSKFDMSADINSCTHKTVYAT